MTEDYQNYTEEETIDQSFQMLSSAFGGSFLLFVLLSVGIMIATRNFIFDFQLVVNGLILVGGYFLIKRYAETYKKVNKMEKMLFVMNLKLNALNDELKKLNEQ